MRSETSFQGPWLWAEVMPAERTRGALNLAPWLDRGLWTLDWDRPFLQIQSFSILTQSDPKGARLSSLLINYQASDLVSWVSWTAQNNRSHFFPLLSFHSFFLSFSHTGKDVQLSLPHSACSSTWLCTAWFSMSVFCCSTGYDLGPSFLVSDNWTQGLCTLNLKCFLNKAQVGYLGTNSPSETMCKVFENKSEIDRCTWEKFLVWIIWLTEKLLM